MAMEILKFPRRYAILLLKGTVEGRIVWKTAALPYFLERDSGQDSVFGRDQTALEDVYKRQILECASMKVEEAALTGESVPVLKTERVLSLEEGTKDVPLGDRKNMVYMLSLIHISHERGG